MNGPPDKSNANDKTVEAEICCQECSHNFNVIAIDTLDESSSDSDWLEFISGNIRYFHCPICNSSNPLDLNLFLNYKPMELDVAYITEQDWVRAIQEDSFLVRKDLQNLVCFSFPELYLKFHYTCVKYRYLFENYTIPELPRVAELHFKYSEIEDNGNGWKPD